MTNLAVMRSEHSRLVILRLLAQAPAEELLRRQVIDKLAQQQGQKSNPSWLHEFMLADGARFTRSELLAAISWLADSGLAVLEQGGKVPVVTLSDRGAEVAVGLIEINGVHPRATVPWIVQGMDSVGISIAEREVSEECVALSDLRLVRIDEALVVWPIQPDAGEVATGKRHVEGVRVPGRAAILQAAVNAHTHLLKGK